MGSSDTGDDDGSLSLGEIERLDLSGCQLAALSACDTNVALPLTVQFRGRPSGGPVVKSRAVTAKSNSGLTIANAFLAGGSQRVVATQWKVADNSTSELFGIFFDKLTAQLAAKQRVNYAQLLADARNELRRKHPEWNTPFYWAPFVLIGPAMGL
jgi:CHAT domain-containing protein